MRLTIHALDRFSERFPDCPRSVYECLDRSVPFGAETPSTLARIDREGTSPAPGSAVHGADHREADPKNRGGAGPLEFPWWRGVQHGHVKGVTGETLEVWAALEAERGDSPRGKQPPHARGTLPAEPDGEGPGQARPSGPK